MNIFESLDNYINKFLIEDLQSDYDKYYNSIPADIFLSLVQQDPTSSANSMQGKKGLYSKWILDKYKAGIITDADLQTDKIKNILSLFNAKKKDLDISKDINTFRSLDDLEAQLNNTKDTELSIKQNSRRLEAVAKNIDLNNYKVGESKNWILYHITDQPSIIRLGRDDNNKWLWCIAATEGGHCDSYAEYVEKFGEGFAYVLVNKNNPNEKYCICEGTGEFNDINNKEADIFELKLDKKIKQVLKKYINLPEIQYIDDPAHFMIDKYIDNHTDPHEIGFEGIADVLNLAQYLYKDKKVSLKLPNMSKDMIEMFERELGIKIQQKNGALYCEDAPVNNILRIVDRFPILPTLVVPVKNLVMTELKYGNSQENITKVMTTLITYYINNL